MDGFGSAHSEFSGSGRFAHTCCIGAFTQTVSPMPMMSPRTSPRSKLPENESGFITVIDACSITGAVIGGLLMGVSEYLVVGYISSTYRDAIAFIILILVLLLKPAGLLGRNVAEKV